MPPLSEYARIVLDRMEPDLRYDTLDLRGSVPDTNVERLREIMHELWINRQVERVGYCGWRRHRSAPPHPPDSASPQAQAVTTDDLFDHASFADFFK